MAEIKWIKIVTDIFDDEKMLLIESLPSADSIMVIWFKLLCFAGKTNNSGVFIFNDRIPYTEEMLASIFRRDVNTVRLALHTFEEYGMIKLIDNIITIPNWGKHQSLDAYERKKVRDRERIAQKRAEQKALVAQSPQMSPDMSPDVASLEVEVEEDIEEDIDIEDIGIEGSRSGVETLTAPQKTSSPAVVISIPLNDNTEFSVTNADVIGWKQLYPAVDIMQELRKMRGWSDANPTKRKTRKGVKRFINGWLASEQDKYRGSDAITGGSKNGTQRTGTVRSLGNEV